VLVVTKQYTRSQFADDDTKLHTDVIGMIPIIQDSVFESVCNAYKNSFLPLCIINEKCYPRLAYSHHCFIVEPTF
jgi:hypothetical protein